MSGNTLALEHALILLLLVVSLLSVRGRARRYAPWVVGAGLALSLLTPPHAYPISWPLLAALVLPMLLWHVARQLSRLRPARFRRSWGLWVGGVIGLTGALALVGEWDWGHSLLMGMVSATLLMGQFRPESGAGAWAILGQLVLALLLVEVDALARGGRLFVGNVIAGASLGVLLGFVGVRGGLHLRALRARNALCFALLYGGYLLGPLLDFSAVVVAFATGLVLAEYGDRAGLWPTRARQPEPLVQPTIFGGLALVYLFLGWQAHAPQPSGLSVLLLLVLGGAGLLWRAAPRRAPVALGEAHPTLMRLFLLLAASLLLWPASGADVPPTLLGLALLGALIGMGCALLMVHSLFDIFGVRPRRVPTVPCEQLHIFDGRGRGETIQVWLN